MTRDRIEISVNASTKGLRRAMTRTRHRVALLAISGHLGPIVAGVMVAAGIATIDLVLGGWSWAVPIDVVAFGLLAYTGARFVVRFRRLERQVEMLMRRPRGEVKIEGREVMRLLVEQARAGAVALEDLERRG